MIITRYIFKNLLGVTVFVALILTLLIMLTQSLRFLELIVETGAPTGSFFYLVSLAVPRFLEIVLPLSIVTAILFIYNKMMMDNELIVLRACGFNQTALMRPALALAAVGFCLLLFLSLWAAPVTHAKMEHLRKVIKAEYASLLLQEGVFNIMGDGLMVYLDKRLDNGDLTGLVIHDTRDTTQTPITIIASSGRILRQDDNTTKVVIFEGQRQQYNPETESLGLLNFSEYTLEVSDLQSDIRLQWKEPDERTIFELLSPDLENQRDVRFLDQFSAEIHHRILTPLTVFNFALIGLFSLLAGTFNRRGQSRRIMAATICIVLLQSVYLALSNAIEAKAWAIPAYYMAVTIPAGICLYLLLPAGEKLRYRLLHRRPA
jgi:lipopolysaccharide export system permease protein